MGSSQTRAQSSGIRGGAACEASAGWTGCEAWPGPRWAQYRGLCGCHRIHNIYLKAINTITKVKRSPSLSQVYQE